MIIAIDIGNTNIVFGGIEGAKTVFSSRLATDKTLTADEYALKFSGILSMRGIDISQIEGGIVSSVVPVLKAVIPEAMKLLCGKTFLVVGSGIKTGLNIKLDDPATVGSDLIVAAVAAKAKYKLPMVIFDLGTATTMTYLDEKGDYTGGMIMPGIWTSLNALSAKAAQLPYIDIEKPAKLLGTNTVDCMRSGAVIGCAAMLDGIIERIEKETGSAVTAVLTGGLATVVSPYCEHNINIESDLLIDGLKLLYVKNTKKRGQNA